jgi:hypothetical protein
MRPLICAHQMRPSNAAILCCHLHAPILCGHLNSSPKYPKKNTNKSIKKRISLQNTNHTPHMRPLTCDHLMCPSHVPISCAHLMRTSQNIPQKSTNKSIKKSYISREYQSFPSNADTYMRPLICAHLYALTYMRPLICAHLYAPTYMRPLICAHLYAPTYMRPSNAPTNMRPLICAHLYAPILCGHLMRPLICAHSYANH